MSRKRARGNPTTTRSPAFVSVDDGLAPLLEIPPFSSDLIRLVRMIARQAAQEAFEVVKCALDERGIGSAHGCQEEAQGRSSGKAGRRHSSPVSDEKCLSVRQAAARLNVSEKKIRRMIEAGELRAHRLGKLFRIREPDLLPPLSVHRPEGSGGHE